MPLNSEGIVARVFFHFSASALIFSLSASILPIYGITQTKILKKEKTMKMKKNSSIKSALVPCILAVVFISLSCVPATIEAQSDWSGQSAKPGAKAQAYTPPPDQMIYLRTGPKEKSVGVTATNFNVPGLPSNLTYFKDTDETIENIGYDSADDPARAAIQVRVTAKYTQVDPGQAANQAVGRAATGAILGALSGLASGGGGQGAAQGAAGGAAYGVTGGSGTPKGIKYLTLEFDISSKRGGTQTGRVTKDISDPEIRLEEFIDSAIGAYLEAALPKR